MLARRGAVLWPWIAALALALLAWNGARFIGTKPQPRMKQLDFLPGPLEARALSLGQPTAVAKLRWIDSFAYFQYQLERLDDRVAGRDGRGGFERLYDTLISLDPDFLPFYQHAVTNTGAILGQNRVALGFVLRGLHRMPRETQLWRLASAELAVSFRWARDNPVALDRWLACWEEAETDEQGKQQVRDWRRGLAFVHVEGLETLPYWLEQLAQATPGTPLADFVEGTIRELLATHGCVVLSELCPGAGGAPLLVDPLALARHYPRGVPPWAPVTPEGQLKPDPYGWPWRREDGRIVSPGLEQVRFGKRTQPLRQRLHAEAERRGRPPRDRAEAEAWLGEALPEPPDGGAWDFRERQPRLRWPDPPQPPWPLRSERRP